MQGLCPCTPHKGLLKKSLVNPQNLKKGEDGVTLLYNKARERSRGKGNLAKIFGGCMVWRKMGILI